MPELPEVETIKNDLAALTAGRIILSAEVIDPFVLRDIGSDDFTGLMTGRQIGRIARVGKMIDFELDEEYHLLFHLKMTGKFYTISGTAPKAECDPGWDVCDRSAVGKHTHIIFTLSGGLFLAFSDIRKFGLVYLKKSSELRTIPYIRYLGIDPFGPDYTKEKFQSLLLTGRKKNIKSFLLDQHYIAGIGNIYASEILFASGIDPRRDVGSLNVSERGTLYHEIRAILAKAIESRGTTFSDYRDVSGATGGFQHLLAVYDREGEECRVCANSILMMRQNGRSTFYCPYCQK